MGRVSADADRCSLKHFPSGRDDHCDAPKSWLISDGADRERMLDMDRAIKPNRGACLVLMAAGLLACLPRLS